MTLITTVYMPDGRRAYLPCRLRPAIYKQISHNLSRLIIRCQLKPANAPVHSCNERIVKPKIGAKQ